MWLFGKTKKKRPMPPVFEFREGNVSVSIWQNRDQKRGPYHRVTFWRIYEQNGLAQWSKGFLLDDLRQLAKAAMRAEKWICHETGQPDNSDESPQPINPASRMATLYKSQQ